MAKQKLFGIVKSAEFNGSEIRVEVGDCPEETKVMIGDKDFSKLFTHLIIKIRADDPVIYFEARMAEER